MTWALRCLPEAKPRADIEEQRSYILLILTKKPWYI
uniref:Uncharacterized protein n=1 Tax=Amphimedon queenslandica TaxID=400682 RepID=A0A1X7TX57_AMPQE